MSRSAGVGGRDVVTRPDACPGDVDSARWIEGIGSRRRPSIRRPHAGPCATRPQGAPATWSSAARLESHPLAPPSWCGRFRRRPAIDRRHESRSRMGSIGCNSAEAAATLRGTHIGPNAAGHAYRQTAPLVMLFGPGPVVVRKVRFATPVQASMMRHHPGGLPSNRFPGRPPSVVR